MGLRPCTRPQSCQPFDDLFALAYQSGSIGYCFAEHPDHMSTPAIPDEAARQALADEGQALIEALVQRMDMPHITAQMRSLEAYNDAAGRQYPWMPSVYHKKR